MTVKWHVRQWYKDDNKDLILNKGNESDSEQSEKQSHHKIWESISHCGLNSVMKVCPEN